MPKSLKKTARPKKIVTAPKRHNLDRRAAAIASSIAGSDDELLTSQQICAWFGVSIQWVEIGRLRGYGPPYERIAPRLIRYRRGRVRQWLDERSHNSTVEYRAFSTMRREPVEA